MMFLQIPLSIMMLLCGVGVLLVVKQFLNDTSYGISTFFDKVRINCILDYDFFVFISMFRNIDLLPLRTFIRSMSKLSTRITLVDPEFGVKIFFALRDCGGYSCRCRHSSFDRLLRLRLIKRHGTRLNFFAT